MRLIFPFIIANLWEKPSETKFLKKILINQQKTNGTILKRASVFVHENVNESLKVNFKSFFSRQMYPEIRYLDKTCFIRENQHASTLKWISVGNVNYICIIEMCNCTSFLIRSIFMSRRKNSEVKVDSSGKTKLKLFQNVWSSVI